MIQYKQKYNKKLNKSIMTASYNVGRVKGK